jgi:hypothetical protein
MSGLVPKELQTTCDNREPEMAKGQKRSGREPKKPKAAKKPPVATASVFNRPPPPKKPLPKSDDK